jgi:hypothetical protein
MYDCALKCPYILIHLVKKWSHCEALKENEFLEICEKMREGEGASWGEFVAHFRQFKSQVVGKKVDFYALHAGTLPPAPSPFLPL